jgi:hypothetical protein
MVLALLKNNPSFVVSWERKYAPQNDSKDSFAAMHDFVIVVNPSDSAISYEHWPYRLAGKTEDATREFKLYAKDQGLKSEPPEGVKPKAFWRLVGDRFVSSGESVLELNSTGLSFIAQGEVAGKRLEILWNWSEATIDLLRSRFDRVSIEEDIPCTENVGIKCNCDVSVRPAEPTEKILADVYERNSWSAIHFSESSIDYAKAVAYHALDGAVWNPNKPDEEFPLAIRDFVAPSGTLLVDLKRLVGNSSVERIASEYVVEGCVVFTHSSKNEIAAIVLGLRLPGQSAPSPLANKVDRVFLNEDDDPRGAWRDPRHKGARSGGPNTAMRLFRPNYSWEIIDGTLPPGLWRLNPWSGVIWGTPTAPGDYSIVVRVRSGHKEMDAVVSIGITDSRQEDSNENGNLQWLFEERDRGGPLRLVKNAFALSAGKSASIVLCAEGGDGDGLKVEPPGELRPDGSRTRYWEFSKSTFEKAVREDKAIWNSGKPTIKQYISNDYKRSQPIRSIQTLSHEEDPLDRVLNAMLQPATGKVSGTEIQFTSETSLTGGCQCLRSDCSAHEAIGSQQRRFAALGFLPARELTRGLGAASEWYSPRLKVHAVYLPIILVTDEVVASVPNGISIICDRSFVTPSQRVMLLPVGVA